MAPVSLGLASSSNLVNSDPLCPGARTPGFYCQNQDGKNPNLDSGEFDDLAAEAESLLGGALGSLSVGDAVCIKGNKLPEDQLLRHLGALALNLAANLIDETTPLTDGSFPTVGDAFEEAVAIAELSDDKQERNAIKDVLDGINNNDNTELGEHCADDDGDDGEEEVGIGE